MLQSTNPEKLSHTEVSRISLVRTKRIDFEGGMGNSRDQEEMGSLEGETTGIGGF